VKEFLELIVELSKEQGLTVLFCSHHLHQVQQVSDRVGIFVNGKLLAEGDIRTLSERLFAGTPYVIEAGINNINPGYNDQGGDKYSREWLERVLKSVEGVIAVEVRDNLIRIQSSRDTSAEVAGALVKAGAGLNYLNRKEYGLDEIYYRYFEGDEAHE
jgi:ABC-2 type transport system ATP-binding protein